MRKTVLVLLVIGIFSIAAFSMTYIGGGVMKEFGGYNRTFGEARVTMGSGLTFDFMAHLDLANMNPADWLQLYTFVNAALSLSDLDLYVGFSPSWFFAGGNFLQSSFQNHGYVHAGAAYNMNQFRIYAEVTYILGYSPFALGNVPMGGIGAQFGF